MYVFIVCFFKVYVQKTFTFFTKLSKSVFGVIIVPFLVAGVSFLSRQYLEDKGAAVSTGKAISTKVSYYMVTTYCWSVSTTPIMAMGCRQCLALSVVQLKGKLCRKPHLLFLLVFISKMSLDTQKKKLN